MIMRMSSQFCYAYVGRREIHIATRVYRFLEKIKYVEFSAKPFSGAIKKALLPATQARMDRYGGSNPDGKYLSAAVAYEILASPRRIISTSSLVGRVVPRIGRIGIITNYCGSVSRSC